MRRGPVVKVFGTGCILQLDRWHPVQQARCASVWWILHKEVCLPQLGPGLLHNETAVLVFCVVGESGGQDDACGRMKQGEGLLSLQKFLLSLPSKACFISKNILGETSWWESCSMAKGNLRAVSCLSVASDVVLRSCFVPRGGFEHQLSWTISSLITYFNVPCTGHSWMWCSGQSHPRMLPFLYLTSDLWKQELIKSSKVAKRKGKCLVTN